MGARPTFASGRIKGLRGAGAVSLGLLVAGVSLVGPASSASSEGRVTLARAPDGTAEVLVGSSRIVGFSFRPDQARLVQRDVSGDGVGDIVVTNVPASSPVRSVSGPVVYSIVTPPEGLPRIVDVGDGGLPASRSKAGDRDNFGYGIGTGPPPCVFYDNREPEDLGVFDYELTTGDEVDVWSHTFTVQGEPTTVRFATFEIFSDGTSSTIDFDGITLIFASPPFAVCDGYPEGGIGRTFVLTGSDALIASDGAVTVTFSENGDDVSLEGGGMLVRFS